MRAQVRERSGFPTTEAGATQQSSSETKLPAEPFEDRRAVDTHIETNSTPEPIDIGESRSELTTLPRPNGESPPARERRTFSRYRVPVNTRRGHSPNSTTNEGRWQG